MNISAQPVQEDHFAYAGQLLVDPGNTKHYARAPEARLKDLLGLDGNTSTDKDETAPFYEAQLVHYGLRRTKNKATAKWRLLEAINTASLTVPENIKMVETRLKRSYGAGSRKVKDPQGPSEPASSTKPSAQPAKRKPDTTESAKPAKRSKAAGTDTVERTSGPSKPATKPAAPRPKSNQTAIASANRSVVANPSVSTLVSPSKTAPASTSKRPLQTARCRRGGYQGSVSSRLGTGSGPTARNVGSAMPASSPAPVREKQTARRSRPFPRHLLPPRIKNESQEPEETYYDAKPQIRDTGTMLSDGKDDFISDLPGRITGDWDISCPEMEQQFHADCTLSLLYVSVDGPRNAPDVVWGKYDLGAFEGVFKAQKVKSRSKKYVKFTFHWRGRETEGAMSFGPRNVGEFTLRDDGYMEGFFGNMWGESLDFEGQKTMSTVADRDLLQYEWNEYNEENYEYENKARWR